MRFPGGWINIPDPTYRDVIVDVFDQIREWLTGKPRIWGPVVTWRRKYPKRLR